MAKDQNESTRVAVEPFKLPVLGGTFTVKEVFTDPGAGLDERVSMIRSTPADRLVEGVALSSGDSGWNHRRVGSGVAALASHASPRDDKCRASRDRVDAAHALAGRN